jgi:hypothetical protein
MLQQVGRWALAKKCFLSFHYKLDNWRVQQVRNIGSIDEQPLLTANKWEEIKEKGDQAIKDWIDDNLKGKECLIVLVGEKTADRPWVKYEIKEAWKKGMGVTAVYIHGLKNSAEEQGKKGKDPFSGLSVDGETIVGVAHDTPYSSSTYVYDHIKENIESWVADAVKARK